MAVIDTTRPNSRVNTYISGFIGSLAQWNDTRVTRNALSRLTNQELDDIGLVRGDIQTIATQNLIR